jgi:L-ascorbate metabolism protein UlaG (beta-lactamase superfamily)
MQNIQPFLRAAFAFALVATAGCTSMQPSTPPNPGAAMATAGTTTAPAGKVQVLWLGQAAFKITTVGGKVIVIDPWLVTNPKTPPAYKTPEALGKVDLVLVNHGHFDHVADAAALARLNNAPLWGPAGLSQSMQTLGILPVAQANRMNKGGSITPFGPGVRITMTHAEHSSELVWRNPATDKDEVHVGGEPAGFVIEFENGFRLWHMGDTGVFGDMKLLGERHRPDLALMPIGGGPFVMNPADAAYAARELIRPKAVIPMHYGTNPALVGTPAEFIRALGEGSIKVLAIQPGESLAF